MDQPENNSNSNFDAARDAMGQIRNEAEKTLRELKDTGGVKAFFTFKKMYFPAFASVIFIIACVSAAVLLLFGMLASFASMARSGIFEGFAAFCGIAFGAVVMIVMTRFWIEIALVAFRINDSLREIRDLLKQKQL